MKNTTLFVVCFALCCGVVFSVKLKPSQIVPYAVQAAYDYYHSIVPFLPEPPYTSTEHNITMRDGVLVNAIVMSPRVGLPAHTVLIHTPYELEWTIPVAEYWVSQGYNVIMLNFRGRFLSGGDVDAWNSTAVDGYDTMAWAVKQPWSTDKLFSVGVSALAVSQYLQANVHPPWLLGQFPQWGNSDVHQFMYHNGAFEEWSVNRYVEMMEEEHLLNELMYYEAFDSYWHKMYVPDATWRQITWPAIHMVGWFDNFQQYQLEAWHKYKTESSSPLRDFNLLVVDPLGHCNINYSGVKFHNSTFGFLFANFMATTMFGILAGDTTIPFSSRVPDFPKILWYVMGPDTPHAVGNYWRTGSEWPSTTSVNYYLHPSNILSHDIPGPTASLSTSFVYNASNPVPLIGGHTMDFFEGKCGPWDQSSTENRSDVLVFTTSAFTENTYVTGHVTAVLYVSSTAVDTDFTVKITDLYPNGTSMLLLEGVNRMRWRNSRTVVQLMEPHRVYEIKVDLWSTSYIFNIGHKLRVAVSSSNFPKYSTNPNTGGTLHANDTAILATNTVHHSKLYPSRIIVPIENPVLCSCHHHPRQHVCGRDRATYDNHCWATCKGVEVEHEGKCQHHVKDEL